MERPLLSSGFDAAIIGGGPAGSHLAIRLARLGRRVALIEARKFPRPKPCGEFLSPECLNILEELGLLERVLSTRSSRITAMELHGHGRVARGEYVDLGGGTRAPEYGLGIRREDLDEVAFRAAATEPGVTVLEGWRGRHLLIGRQGQVEGVQVTDPSGTSHEIHAAFTIGADGLRSMVARGLGSFEAAAWPRKIGLVARFAGMPAQQHAEVHFLDDGYLIAAPVGATELTVNLIIERDAYPVGTKKLEFLQHRLAQIPTLAGRFDKRQPAGRVMAVGALASRTRQQVFDGAALVGDAAGFLDPLTGEGVYFAIHGAALLAPVINDALSEGRCDAEVLAPYQKARKKAFGQRLRLARWLQHGLRSPAITRMVLSVLSARPRLADLLVTVTGDAVKPTRALRPRHLIPALLMRHRVDMHDLNESGQGKRLSPTCR